MLNKRIRNTANFVDWHRELFGAGQILGKLKLLDSELAGDWRRSRRSVSLFFCRSSEKLYIREEI